MHFTRRRFIRNLSYLAAGGTLLPACTSSAPAEDQGGSPPFKISLAQWSLNRDFKSGKFDNLDFPSIAKEQFGIEAVEYVNQFFFDKARDRQYLQQLKTRAEDAGVRSLLIMVDNEGHLGNLDPAERIKAVENHHKWVEAAQFLGCHSIRVNAAGEGPAAGVKAAVIDSLTALCTFARDFDINVIVENHGGYSSDAAWLADAIAQVGMPNCGTLPDFGNFTINQEEGRTYDRYQGVQELMPYAKAVSAKCYEFGPQGQETTIDFARMMDIVLAAGYHGYVGIEYEGAEGTEEEGIRAAKALLEEIKASKM